MLNLMAIFGDLADMSTPEVLHMLGPRTGKLLIRPDPKKKYELHLSEGVILCFKDDGFSVRDTSALRLSVTNLLEMRVGGFEFSQTPLNTLEREVNFTQQEIWQIAASLDTETDTSTTEHTPDQATRFKLKTGFDTSLKLPDDLSDFMRRGHDQLFVGCSASELADSLRLPVAQIQVYFQRLRSLGRITPVRAYATNYSSYQPAHVVVSAVAAPAPRSYSQTTSTPARTPTPIRTEQSAPPKQSFVRRLLAAFSFGAK